MDDIEKGMHLILKGLQHDLGLNLSDVNFKDTPKRVARAYHEIFEGLKDTEIKVKKILSTAFPSEGYGSLIFCSDIVVFSMCPHHFLPVEYKVSVGYIPSESGMVLGASKIPRLVELLAKRPVLQETLTVDIANYLNTLKPVGVAVVVSGVHFCMRMRGIKKMSTFETSAMKGAFMDNLASRKEFFDLLLLSKKN
jgi:GTP cyclohydrolase IA